MGFKNGHPSCDFCSARIKSQRVRKASDFKLRLDFYYQHTNNLDPRDVDDIICSSCQAKVLNYCKKYGFVSKPKSTEEQPKVTAPLSPPSTRSGRIRRAAASVTSSAQKLQKIADLEQPENNESASTNCPEAPNGKLEVKQKHEILQQLENDYGNYNSETISSHSSQPENLPKIACDATTTVSEQAQTDQTTPQSSNDTPNTQSNDLSSLQNSETQPEACEKQKIQTSDVYSSSSQNTLSSTLSSASTQSQMSCPPAQAKITIPVFSITSFESYCFVCSKRGPSNRKVVPAKAFRNIWEKEKIYLPMKSRICLEHLTDDGVFDQSSRQQIHKIKRFGVEIGPQDVLNWANKLCKNSTKNYLDFDDESISSATYEDFLGLSKQNFDEVLSFIQEFLHKSNNRSPRNALALFLTKLRLGLSQKILARLFGLRSQVSVSRVFRRVEALLTEHFVPKYLGYNHIQRDNLLTNHTPSFVKDLFDVPKDKLVTVWDGTYIYTDQPSDHELAKKMYSTHKHAYLVKFMMITTPDGYIIDAPGPYGADGNNSDAKIMNSMMDDGITFPSVLEPAEHNHIGHFVRRGDVIILDRGFRDSSNSLDDRGVVNHMPSFIDPDKEQLTVEQADYSRFVTLVRFEVEVINGKISNKWRFFDTTVCLSYLDIIGGLFRIVCALHNKFFVPIVYDEERHNLILWQIEERRRIESELQDYEKLRNMVPIFELDQRIEWLAANASVLEDFPRLSDEDLFLLTLGSYQLKMARQYNLRHLRHNPSYLLFLHKQYANVLRAKIKSRFRSNVEHNLWIQYDRSQEGPNKIVAYYCKCQQGNRNIAICSHVAAVVLYLGKERYEVQRKPKKDRLSLLLNAAKRTTERPANVADSEPLPQEPMPKDSGSHIMLPKSLTSQNVAPEEEESQDQEFQDTMYRDEEDFTVQLEDGDEDFIVGEISLDV